MRNEAIVLTPLVKDWISRSLPALDLDRVHFRRGLPWFMREKSWVSGITLPHPYRASETVIYLKYWPADEVFDRPWADLETELSLLGHECFHALQRQEAASIMPSWTHPEAFLSAYFADWTRFGYRQHPLELTAKAYDADLREWVQDQDVQPDWRQLPVREESAFRMESGNARLVFGLLLANAARFARAFALFLTGRY
jgi:hypothetical protein